MPHDAAAIARAIERILVEPGLHAKLAVGAREAAARLGWEEPALTMEALYDRLVKAESGVA